MKILKNRPFIFLLSIGILIPSLVGITASIDNPGVEAANDTLTRVLMAGWADAYNGLDELCESADLIVTGEISKTLEEKQINSSMVETEEVLLWFTDSLFTVDQVLKGKDVEQILIHQTGAQGKQEVIDDPVFIVKDKCILFLHEYEDGKYFVEGGPQGRFMVVNEKVYSMNNILLEVASVSVALDVNNLDMNSFINSIIETVNKTS